jgi:hypothetical protein
MIRIVLNLFLLSIVVNATDSTRAPLSAGWFSGDPLAKAHGDSVASGDTNLSCLERQPALQFDARRLSGPPLQAPSRCTVPAAV